MTHHVSPLLETDGVLARRIGCAKNDDGTLHCTVTTEDGTEVHGSSFDLVSTQDGIDNSTYRPTDQNRHLEINFDEAVRCEAHGTRLICQRG